MQDLNREYAWASSLQNGECCPQNCAFKLAPSDIVPDELLANLPYGHGVRVVNIGPRPKLLEMMQTDKIELVQQALKEAMPENVPADTLVHIGLRTKLDQRPFQEHVSDVFLSVYAHDQAAASDAAKAIKREHYLKTQRDEAFTMRNLMDLGVLVKCEVESETYRANLIELMANALNSVAPVEDVIRGRSPVMDVCQTTVHSMDNDELIVGLGMNIGKSGVVWHTPTVGMTLFFPRGEDAELNIIPASNGRNVMYCASKTEGFGGMPIAQAMEHVTNQTRTQGIGSICAAHAPGYNEYTHVDLYESTYKTRSKLDIFQLIKGSKWAVASTSLLTVVPGIQNVSGVLYGHVECNNLHHLLKYTDPECDSILVPNEPKWRDQLTELDDSGASYAFQRTDNAVPNSSNKVASYRLPKSQISDLLHK